MATWDELRRFLVIRCGAAERGDGVTLTVECENGRKQIVGVRPTVDGRFIVNSPFARASEQASVLVRLLPLICEATLYGIRQEGDYLSLSCVGDPDTTEPVDINALVRDVAKEADRIEDFLTEGRDGF